MEVGLKIGKYLKDRGIKQAFLVEKTGLTANSVSDICTGSRKIIDCMDYYRICRALGVTMETFIDDADLEG